jgi:hypothetical protein
MPPGGPLGTLLTSLLWLRGVASPAEAEAFLEPTLAHGLRPPADLPGLDAASAKLAAVIAGGGAIDVVPAPTVGAVVAAAAIRDGLGAAGGQDLSIHVHPDDIELDGVRVDGRPFGFGAAGVAFYLLIALRRDLRGRVAVRDPRAQLDLAALGTLADGSVLRDEGRVLVALGLRAMHDVPRPGVVALAEMALVARPTARAVVARILPRLTAAVALGAVERVTTLLTTTSPDEAARAAAAIEVDAASSQTHAATTSDDAAVVVDAEWSLAEIGARTMLALGRLEPHGPGNPEPVLIARGARLDGARLAGDPTRPYWRLRLRQDSHTVRAVAQHLRTGEIAVGRLYDVAYSPRPTHVRGGGPTEIAVHDLHEHAPVPTGQTAETTGQKTLS